MRRGLLLWKRGDTAILNLSSETPALPFRGRETALVVLGRPMAQSSGPPQFYLGLSGPVKLTFDTQELTSETKYRAESSERLLFLFQHLHLYSAKITSSTEKETLNICRIKQETTALHSLQYHAYVSLLAFVLTCCCCISKYISIWLYLKIF